MYCILTLNSLYTECVRGLNLYVYIQMKTCLFGSLYVYTVSMSLVKQTKKERKELLYSISE